MCPISIEREMLKDAFLSWDKMDEYISAKQTKIQATLTLALMALKRGLVNCAIARSDVTGTAVHLITDAVADGVLEQIPVVDDDPRNPTFKEALQHPEWIAYCLERIDDVRIVEAQVSGTSVGDGRLGGNLCIGSLTGVGSQDLHPLGSHVVVGIHRHSCRFVQLPVVELIHRVDRHHTVVNLLCNIHIIKVVVLAGNMHGQHSSQPQQGYQFEISHNRCLFFRIAIRWQNYKNNQINKTFFRLF